MLGNFGTRSSKSVSFTDSVSELNEQIYVKKVKLSRQQAVEAYRVVRC
jgi:hypothetical protein